jgi:asparagine N-glycosylation enzyme membrane subunit Stt3
MHYRRLPNLSKKQWVGFACIYLAGLGWLADLIIPFTLLPHKHIYFVIALSLAEASFLLGVALLGRAYYHQLKSKLLDQIKNRHR